MNKKILSIVWAFIFLANASICFAAVELDANSDGMIDSQFLRWPSEVTEAEPSDEVQGDLFLADGTWDPVSYGATLHLVLCTATNTYVLLRDMETGQWFASEIDMRGGTFTSDRKHVTKSGNGSISEDESYGYTIFVTAAAELEMQAVADGMYFCVENHTTGAVILDQNGTQSIKLNGASASTTAITGTDTGGDGYMVCCEYFTTNTWSCQAYGYTQ